MTDSVEIHAAVCRQFGAPLQIETLHLSPPLPRQVRVQLSACAICHSDITYMDGGWGGDTPIVLGHEAAGVVVESGAESGIAKGARVLATLMRACGDCLVCARGLPALCKTPFDAVSHLHDSSGESVHVGLKTAAFAEQVVVDCSQVAMVDDDLPLAEASLLSCGVMTGWGAVANTAQLPSGASAAVVGCGGVGVNCLQAAAYYGASPLLAVDTADAKLELAMQFGATHVLNPSSANFKSELQKISGRYFDYVFMAAGSGRATEQAAAMIGAMGTLVLAGMPPDGDLAALDVSRIADGQQRILGSKMGGAQLSVDIPRLQSLHAAGHLKLSELIGGRYPLSDINAAIADSRRGGALRNVIEF